MKIDGIRVEPGESAHLLAQHPAVDQCVVLPVGDGDSVRLEAFIVPADDPPVAARELRAHLRGWLRTASIPSAFHMVGAIPLTVNKKTDHQALLNAVDDGDEAFPGATDDIGNEADSIRDAWVAVLGDPAGRPDADFFALGGSSLRGLRILDQLEASTGVTADLDLFFECPTLREFSAAFLELAAGPQLATSVRATASAPGGEPGHRLSFAQERLWFVEQLASGTSAYIISIPRRVTGPLDITALEAAFTALVGRHEVLRSRVGTQRGEPELMILPPTPVEAEVVDARATSLNPDELDAIVASMADRPFDLATDLLARLGVIRLADHESIVVMSFHHLVMDGMSYSTLFREVGALYSSHLADRESQLAPLPAQYAAFAAWQRDRASAGGFAADLRYWSEVLRSRPGRLRGTPDSGGQDQVGVVARRDLHPELATLLHTAPADLRATPFMVAVALVAAVVCDDGGSDDFATALIAADREWAPATELIGYFVNTLPLTLTLAGTDSFADLVHQTRNTVLNANAHSAVPLDLILAQAKLAPHQVDAFINHIDVEVRDPELDLVPFGLEGTSTSVYERQTEACKFDLTFSLSFHVDDPTLVVKGRSSVFGQGDVDRLADALVATATRLLGNTHLPLAPERAAAAEADHVLVPELVRRTIASDAVTLVEEAGTWTGGNFAEATERVRGYLASRGVGPGDRVIIAVERSRAAIAAMYALWDRGASYVPLDPEHHSERSDLIAADTAATLVIDQGVLAEAIAFGDPAPAPVDVAPDDIAYVIYTSGSTGQPKGVEVPHRALSAFTRAAADAYGITAADTMLQFHSLAFDGSVEEIHLPLSVGARVVLRTPELLGSVQRLAAFIEHHGITVVSLPTAFWHELVHQATAEGLSLPTCLRTVIIGGQAARPDLIDQWHQLPHPAGHPPKLINSYGPTETTVAVTSTELTPDADGDVSIGHPFTGVTAEVFDGALAVTDGGWGELQLSGDQLATGYLGQPDATTAAFVTRGGTRWYRTGDRARWRSDGALEVGGRIDDQVKVDGHRVEPAEVETALRALDGVTEAAVVAHHDDMGTSLHAFVTGSGLDPTSLRGELAHRVPPAMVPGSITPLDTLPVGASNKVDRHALRQMLRLGTVPKRNISEADGGALSRVCGIWAELLSVDSVAADANFFELGGRSLTAVRLAYLLESAFDVEVPVATIFEHPTPAGLVAALDISDEVTPPAPAQGMPDRRSTGPTRLHLDVAPLAPAQQRLWLHAQLREGTVGYRIPVQYRLRGELDIDALRRAIEALVLRHESLRSRIVVTNGKPMLHIDTTRVPGQELLDVIDLATGDPTQREPAVAETVAAHIARPFDLATQHPFDALLVRVAPDDHRLVLRFHHVAVDDQAVTVIVRELGTHFAAELGKGPAPAAPKLQFSDFAVWQQAKVHSGKHADALTSWQQRLANHTEPLDLPGRRPQAVPGGQVRRHEVDLAPDTVVALEQLAAADGLSLFQVLAALTAATVYRLTGEPHVTVASPGSERTRPEAQAAVGLFVNTMVLPTSIEQSTSFRQLLADVQAAVAHAITDTVPFDLLVDALGISREPTRLPLAGVMCTLREADARAALDLHGVTTEPVASTSDDGALITDLMVAGVRQSDDSLTVSLRHDEQVLEGWVVAEVARVFATIAQAAASQPDVPLSALPTMSAAELRWLTLDLNDAATPFPEDERLEASVAAVATRQPHAIAVVDDRRSLTYQALQDEAVAIAQRLAERGVGSGHAVGVRVPRSASLVTAILGILQAGGVYVPIDAAAPQSRQEDILRLAGAQAIITLGADDTSLDIEGTDYRSVIYPKSTSEPAYVMFTSGSTGTPKGAVISHRAVQRTVQNINYVDLGPDDVLAMLSNPAFDALTFEIWGALVNGGRIEAFDTDTLADPHELARQLSDRGVTAMFMTTSLVNLVTAAVPDAFTSVDTLLVGGEAVDPGTMAALLQRGPRRLLNGYGPTECTTFSVWHHVDHIDEELSTVPIGRPTSNTVLHVLDEFGQVAPRGVTGELHIGGPGLADGYIGDPALTAERFVERTVGGASQRLYRTGDTVRRLTDGTIEYLGRRDHQIKLRGFRIELTGIEAALLGDHDVGAAVVQLVGTGSSRRLVAHLALTTAAKQADDALSGIQQRLRDRLPSYMVPAQFVVHAEMPLNRSGKIDRMALVAPEPDAVTADIEGLDPIDASIVTLWADLLERGDLGPDDDFFESGGNSLLGIEALAAVEEHYGVHLRLSSLFDARTPRAFADLVRQQHQDTPVAVSAHLVTLQPGTPNATPLWLIHPAGGSLVLYEPLVRHLPAQRAIRGVEASGVDGRTPPIDDVPGLADHQLSHILASQPTGPYRILGYSIGGIVGLELARRLIDRGHQVEFLGAIEAGVPAGPPEILARRKKYGRLLRQRDFAGIGKVFWSSMQTRRREFRLTRAAGRSELDRAHRQVLDSMVHAFHHFSPTSLDVSMTLFYGAETDDESAARLTRRWGALATRGVTLRTVSGSHADDSVLRDPHARVLAAAVEAELRAIDEDDTRG